MAAATPQDLQELRRLMDEFTRSQSRITEENRRLHTSTQIVNDEMEMYNHELKNTTDLSKKQNELYRKTYDARKKQYELGQRIARQEHALANINDEIAAVGVATKQQSEDFLRIEKMLNVLREQQKVAINESNKAHKKFTASLHGTQGALGKLSSKLEGFSGPLGSFGSAIGGATSGLGLLGMVAGAVWSQLNKGLDQYKNTLVGNGGAIEGSSVEAGIRRQLELGATRGISNTDIAKMSSEFRQASNALGGFENTLVMTDATANNYMGMVGDTTEAHRQALRTTHDYMKLGIKPTSQALERFSEDMLTQNKINGMSLEQSRALYDNVANEADSITLLRAARAGERDAILANQRALIQSNEALGMTAEQAAEAAKMLNKMVAQKPLERLRQAAKIRAYGAAMGMGPESELAAQAVQAGKLATAAQKENLSRFGTMVANQQDTLAQRGLGAELVGSTLLEKTGLEQYFGPGSSFSTTLGSEMAKPVEELKATFKEFKDSGLTTALTGQQIMKNAVDALSNGTGALYAATWVLEDTMLDSNNVLKTMSAIPNAIMKLGQDTMALWGRAVDIVMAPFQLLGGFLEQIAGGWAKIFEKIAGFFGMDSLSAMFKASGDSMLDTVDKLYGSVMAGWRDKEPVQATAPDQPKPEQSADKIKEDQAKAAVVQNADHSAKILEATKTQHTTFNQQLTKLDESSKYLKVLADNSPVMVDLAQKTLAAVTMSETQKQKYASNLSRSNSKFAAEYAFVN